jgi:hypothetical protein
MQKRIEQFDPQTGQIMQGCVVFIPNKPKISERWFMAFQDIFEELAKDPEMTGESYRVLFFLYSKLDFENFIQQSQMDIAEGLGMQKQRVSRAMKVLTSKQIILEGPKVGRSRCYRLNPDYGWKGKVKTFNEARKEQKEQRRKGNITTLDASEG